jgi:hypothetical protein
MNAMYNMSKLEAERLRVPGHSKLAIVKNK